MSNESIARSALRYYGYAGIVRFLKSILHDLGLVLLNSIQQKQMLLIQNDGVLKTINDRRRRSYHKIRGVPKPRCRGCCQAGASTLVQQSACLGTGSTAPCFPVLSICHIIVLPQRMVASAEVECPPKLQHAQSPE